jgi:salicylate hydroxylase
MAHYYDFLRWQDGSRIQWIRLENSKETFGSPYYTVHLTDLHIALFEKAQAAGVTIIGNKRVLSYDFEAPSVSVEGGAPKLAPRKIVHHAAGFVLYS